MWVILVSLIGLASASLVAEVAVLPSTLPEPGLAILDGGRSILYNTNTALPTLLPGSLSVPFEFYGPFLQLLDDRAAFGAVYHCAVDGAMVWLGDTWYRRHTSCAGVAMSATIVYTHIAASSRLYLYDRTNPSAASTSSISTVAFDSTWVQNALQVTDDGTALIVPIAIGKLSVYNLTATTLSLLGDVTVPELTGGTVHGSAFLLLDIVCYLVPGRAPCFHLPDLVAQAS